MAAPSSTAVDTVDTWLDLFNREDLSPDAAAELLAEDATFVEHPNLVSPAGSCRDRAAMLAGIEVGATLLRYQRFVDREHDILGDSRVFSRARWEGELAVDLGSWSAGTTLNADVAMLFDVAEGRVRRQENWDCYHQPIAPS